ncbi:hypothetical protein QQY24_01810 [Streptomyces sp. TG1A-8]|uniref:hypothetical protein n=1 Tax=Streptomyces sp. TG1A-8 TaxID=3051385 RepID=UPI00265BCD11|nr:hypothetical protein [Streptomyces sp. TG1A-8]MDO0924210.1 hypothetical protein [Streptomyces sp. TG1A-8]
MVRCAAPGPAFHPSSSRPKAARRLVQGSVGERPARGGPACARLLQRPGVDVTVYDLDADATARDQGGTLDMQPGTGQYALRAAGPWEDLTSLARPEDEQTRLVARDGRALFDAGPPRDGPGNPGTDRGQEDIDGAFAPDSAERTFAHMTAHR